MPFEPIRAYVKRQGNVNTIPEEDPTKAPNGIIQPYAKREEALQGTLEL